MSDKDLSIQPSADDSDRRRSTRVKRARADKPVPALSPVLKDIYRHCIETGLKVAQGHEALMSFLVMTGTATSYFHYVPKHMRYAESFAYDRSLARRMREDILVEMMPEHLKKQFTDKEVIMRYKDSLMNNPLHDVLESHFRRDMYAVTSPLCSKGNRERFLNCLEGQGQNGTLFDKRDMIVFALENMEWQAAEAEIEPATRCDFLAIVDGHKKDICDVTQAVADFALHLSKEDVPYWFHTGWKKALKAEQKI